MKIFQALIAALAYTCAINAQATLVKDADSSAAAALATLPHCAIFCLAAVVPTSTCSLTNTTCMCENASLQSQVSQCVMNACSVKDMLITKNTTATTCAEPVRNKTGQYVAISNAFGIISAIFVVQRFAYKIWAGLLLGLDDWFTLVTLVSGVPSTIITALCVAPNGIGRDIWTLAFHQVTEFGKFFFIMEALYFFQVASLKVALLFFYMRVFPAQPVQRLLWGTIAFSAIFAAVSVAVALLQCRPMSFYWTKWDGEHQGSCLNVNALAWSNASISILLDGWMLAIPLWQLKSLNLHWKRKIGVGLMFCVGTFVTVVSILRLQSLVDFGTASMNPTWDFFNVGVWSTVEINVGIICACMPSLRLLLAKVFPQFMDTMRDKYSNRGRTKDGSTSLSKSQPLSKRSRTLSNGCVSPSPAPTHDVQPSALYYPGCIQFQPIELRSINDDEEVELVDRTKRCTEYV